MAQIVRIIVRVEPTKRHEFEQSLNLLLHNGIHSNCHLSSPEVQSDGTRLYYYFEEWEKTEELDIHQQCDYFQTLIGAMKVLGTIEDAKIINTTTSKTIEQAFS